MKNRRGKGRFGRSRAKCSYCKRLGHTRGVCYSTPKCSYCNRLGHTHGICYSLHGRPTKNAHIAQSNTTGDQRVYLSDKEYNEYLQYQASKHIFLPIAPTAQSPTFGSWVVDSSASDHISGDKSLLSDIVYSQSLPAITLANGIRTEPKGVGQDKPLSSVTLDSVLYVPGCPFNLASVSHLTRALDCSINFFL
ncbi:uncharacterized protein LOC124896650 [Capsicum annuum]|uniref:uncharacterized protein LOC124896650 n=1 Tax=Capsicum annuum TaxID=4072 RepID=UPI001FB0E109|nr:uncharacterized protein LOC124896650 [Capsicum annuum]